MHWAQALNGCNISYLIRAAATFTTFLPTLSALLLHLFFITFLFQEKNGKNKVLVVAGGVAANMQIRKGLNTLASDHDMDFVAPPMNLCTDNAAMIAWAGVEKLKLGHRTDLDFVPRPRWPLSEL